MLYQLKNIFLQTICSQNKQASLFFEGLDLEVIKYRKVNS